MLALLALAAASLPGSDLVVLANGDRLTGTLKKMDAGELYIQTTYYQGKLPVDWHQVASIQAAERFQVLLVNGERLIGRIEKLAPPAPPAADFEVYQSGGTVWAAARDVVWIHPEKPTFLRQLTGNVGAGAGFTSGNNQHSLYVNAQTSYATPAWQAGGTYSGTFNGQPGARKTNTQNAGVEGEWFLRPRSFLIAYLAALHSRQQKISLLSAYGGGYGFYFVRRSNAFWNVFGGAAYLRERFTVAGRPLQQAVAALLGTQLDLLRFNVGEVQSQLALLPVASQGGRLLLTNTNSLGIKLPNNFYFTFSAWDNFNSRPPPSSNRNELGLNTTIGYSF
ncbi:MAG: DUF481 domain-containing protein [Terriglobales bacterium]